MVEDHDVTRTVLTDIFLRLGFDVVAVGTVAGAIHATTTHSFGALVSDIGLPDGSGCEVMLAAKREQPGIRGLAMTAALSESVEWEAHAAGFDLLLRKPLRYLELRSAVQRLTV